jgi:hypothetical protein
MFINWRVRGLFGRGKDNPISSSQIWEELTPEERISESGHGVVPANLRELTPE